MSTAFDDAAVGAVATPLNEATLLEYLGRVELRLGRHLSRVLPGLLAEVISDRLIDARYSYGLYAAADIGAGRVTLANGMLLTAPLVAHRMKRASMLAFAVVTLGPRLAARAAGLVRDGSVVRAMLLEGIAGYALGQAISALCEALDEDALARGLSCSGYINPGDFGFDLANQRTVLELAHASRIDVACTDGSAISPIHSVSAVFGVGRRMRKWTQIENCQTCPSKDRCVHLRAASG